MEEEDNALWKHCQLEHNGEKVEFSMKALGSFQSTMARQVNEGVRIKRSKADCLMNSKSEFHQQPGGQSGANERDRAGAGRRPAEGKGS